MFMTYGEAANTSPEGLVQTWPKRAIGKDGIIT
jgi:hypothetical protein